MKLRPVAVFAALCGLAVSAAPALADRVVIDPAQGGSIEEDTTPAPLTERPRDVMFVVPADPMQPPAVNSHVIFLNSCRPSGCHVGVGQASSINDTWPIGSPGTLSAFDDGDVVWGQVVQCVKETFAPFNITITDVDPGTAPHFEIMIAGAPADLHMSNGVGGISPFNCNASGGYISNSLVFDFSKVWQGSVNEICATAAQEVAHSFLLDHVIEPSDPMTYNAYSGQRHFQNGSHCGSDCQGGQGPFGQACSGTGGMATHSCTCTGSATQNDITIITNLFGANTIAPPVVTIKNPKSGEAVEPGFPVGIDVTDPGGYSLKSAALKIDGTVTQSLTTQPFAFNAPSDLGDGTHTVEVDVTDVFDVTGKATVSVYIGKPCEKPGDCPNNTDTCIGGRCVPGPGVQGGLGDTCMQPSDCASGICQADSSGAQYCVETCDLGQHQCPGGFGCLDRGDGSGVCWPGYDDGGGGCDAGGRGALGLGICLGLAGLAIRRPRKR